MGCEKYTIQDYLQLRSSQTIPVLKNFSSTYTYDDKTPPDNTKRTDIQLLFCIQNVLKILFQFCDLRTNAPTFTLTTYTYNNTFLSSIHANNKGISTSSNKSQLTYIYNRGGIDNFSHKNDDKIIQHSITQKHPIASNHLFVYYNYRYYSAELGRWLSRDPIEEEGGDNLYGIINNNAVNVIDLLGLGFWKWVARVTTTTAAGIITLPSGGWGAIVVGGLWATEGVADLTNKYNQGEIDIHNRKIEYENLLNEERAKEAYRKGKSCVEKCREANIKVLDSAGKIAAAIIKNTPGTTVTGPVVGAQPRSTNISRNNPTITGDRPGYKTVTGAQKTTASGKEIFVPKYHRSAPGGTPIPKDYNNQYPKPKIKMN